MDIVRKQKNKLPWKRYWPIFAAVVTLLIILVASSRFGSASYAVDRDSVVFGEVRRGEFSVQVRGTGILVPKNIQWVSANVEGRVDEISVDAGSSVKEGDIIATLSNPSLKEMLEETHWELEAQIKENRAAEVSLESQLANLRADVLDAEFAYNTAKLQFEAQSKLIDMGNTTVPRLTYETTKLTVAQEKERIKTQKDRVEKMEQNLAALREAHAARVNKMRNTLNRIQHQVDDLTVRARIDGVVQKMAVKLGQQLTSGTEVAKIVPHDDLVAMLDIQAFQVRDVVLGQAVTIDTHSSKIAGEVARIEPAATGGIVKVEVELLDKLPPEARPDLSLEGIIDIDHKPDALYVNRPTFAQSYQKTTLFRVSEDGSSASRVNVELGRASTRHIEVLSGLRDGDRIIVSDPSAWEKHKNVLIN